jgi:hypothetical protein
MDMEYLSRLSHVTATLFEGIWNTHFMFSVCYGVRMLRSALNIQNDTLTSSYKYQLKFEHSLHHLAYTQPKPTHDTCFHSEDKASRTTPRTFQISSLISIRNFETLKNTDCESG